MNKTLYLGLGLVSIANLILFASRLLAHAADPHLLFGLSSS